MRNSIYDLKFEEVMVIAKEANEIWDKYWEPKGLTKAQYEEAVTDLCNMHDISINVFNKCRREYRWCLNCSEKDIERAIKKFEYRKHPYELKQKREQAKLDLLKEEMRKELMAELGL